MKEQRLDFLNNNLVLYFEYDHLPVWQFSTILSSLNDIFFYCSIIQNKNLIVEQERYDLNDLPVLEINAIHTGNSIISELNLPEKATKIFASLALAGIIVTFGMDTYESNLRAENLILSNKKIKLEISKLEHEFDRQRRLENDMIYDIENARNILLGQFNSKNIKSTKINGQLVQAH